MNEHHQNSNYKVEETEGIARAMGYMACNTRLTKTN